MVLDLLCCGSDTSGFLCFCVLCCELRLGFGRIFLSSFLLCRFDFYSTRVWPKKETHCRGRKIWKKNVDPEKMACKQACEKKYILDPLLEIFGLIGQYLDIFDLLIKQIK